MIGGTVCQRSHCRGVKRNARQNLNTQLIALSFVVLLGAIIIMSLLLAQWLFHLQQQQCLCLHLFLHQATLKQAFVFVLFFVFCVDMNRKNKVQIWVRDSFCTYKVVGVLNVSVFCCVMRLIPCKVFVFDRKWASS